VSERLRRVFPLATIMDEVERIKAAFEQGGIRSWIVPLPFFASKDAKPDVPAVRHALLGIREQDWDVALEKYRELRAQAPPPAGTYSASLFDGNDPTQCPACSTRLAGGDVVERCPECDFRF
jgi:hypothetical protein